MIIAVINVIYALTCRRFYIRIQNHARYATLNYIGSPNGRFQALRLPYNPNQWIPTISAYHACFPHIRRVMIDEAQCINSVYLVTLIMVIRDFYLNVPVIFTSIDYDSWHHKLPQLVSKSHHMHHKCIFCHRVANCRLHVINNHPAYNEKKYDYALSIINIVKTVARTCIQFAFGTIATRRRI